MISCIIISILCTATGKQALLHTYPASIIKLETFLGFLLLLQPQFLGVLGR